MNILFVCRYNRFRSRIAEAYFKKINKNKKIKVKSAGIFRGSYPLDKLQVNLAKKFGITIKGKPQRLSTDLLKWQDIIVNVANDVPNSLFEDNVKIYKKKSIYWKIPDETRGNKKNINNIVKLIMKKTDVLVNNLEKK